MKVKIKNDLPKVSEDAWYFNLRSREYDVEEDLNEITCYKLVGQPLWIGKSDCAVLSDTSQEAKVEPKGYCIKRTPENAEVLNKWANNKEFPDGYVFYTNKDGYVYSEKICGNYCVGELHEGLTELFTVEEFFDKVGYKPEPKCHAPVEPVKTEYVPACSQTGELFGYMLSKHGLNFSTEDLKAIIEIANRSRVEEVKEEVIERIPFDLEKWKTGKYDVVTRNGWNVYIIKTDLNDQWRKPLVGVLCYGAIGKSRETVCSWSIKGEEHIGERPTDLFLIPKIKTVWVNVWHSEEHNSEFDAKFMSSLEDISKCKLMQTIQVAKPIK